MAVNGRLAGDELATIPDAGGAQVRADLLAQVIAWRAAFAAEFGKPLLPSGRFDAYRPLSVQESIFRARYTPLRLVGRPVRYWNGLAWYQRPNTAQAAVPGTSNHGWATAIDWGSGVNVKGSVEHAWCVANAPAFGFQWPWWAAAAGEYWHFEGGHVVPISRYITIPGVSIPTPGGADPTPLEADMPLNSADLTAIDNLIKANVANSLAHLIAFTAEIPARAAAQVWAQPVARLEGHPTTALQDAVDGTTAALEIQATLAARP